MKCKECIYWLHDLSMPLRLGYCSAKNCICTDNDLCEIFKRKDVGVIAVRVPSY
ncbi:MAG: hypothetical protein RMH75_05095 [Archaeoglobaceae archaeon]|nr:hypothetical protein [Archaeoglobaceae archaeon]